MTETISLGITLVIPERGEVDWDATMKTAMEAISSHDHTASGKGVQLGTSSITADQITDALIRLRNNQFLRGRNNAGSGDIDIVKVNTSDAIEFASAVTLLADSVDGTAIRLDNDQFLRARNNAHSANLNVLKADTSDQTVVNSLVTLLLQIGATTILNMTSTTLEPETNNSVDLGTSSKAFKDLYLTNTIKVDSVVEKTGAAGVFVDALKIKDGEPLLSVTTGISAAGTVQGDATALTDKINEVTTIAAAAGVRLPSPVAGKIVYVEKHDGTSNQLKIYPASGHTIAQFAVNTSFNISTDGRTAIFIGMSTTHWGINVTA